MDPGVSFFFFISEIQCFFSIPVSEPVSLDDFLISSWLASVHLPLVETMWSVEAPEHLCSSQPRQFCSFIYTQVQLADLVASIPSFYASIILQRTFALTAIHTLAAFWGLGIFSTSSSTFILFYSIRVA